MQRNSSLITALIATWLMHAPLVHAGEPAVSKAQNEVEASGQVFREKVNPLLATYCYDCHGNGQSEGSVSLDTLDSDMVNGPDAESWHAVLDVLNAGDMPPEDQSQPDDDERRMLVDWMTKSLTQAANARQRQPKGVMRRLTKQQYSNTLGELLGIPIRFGDVLPDDGKSKMGFSNNGDVLQISPLHIDYYRSIARNALDTAIVHGDRPEAIRYRVTLGENVGKGHAGAEFEGYQTAAVSSDDFRIDMLDSQGVPVKPESDEVETAMNEIKSKIGVGLRGSSNDRFGVVRDGMMLYSALPHKYLPPRSWQGPSPNMKMVIKDNYPRSGAVRMLAKVSRGHPLKTRMGLIGLRNEKPAATSPDAIRVMAKADEKNDNLQVKEGVGLVPIDVASFSTAPLKLRIPRTGYYQLDLVHPWAPEDSMPSFLLNIKTVGRVQERLYLDESQEGQSKIVTPISLAFLKKGKYSLSLGGKFFVGFSELIVTPLPMDNALSRRLSREAAVSQKKYASENPSVRVFAGTRTDDGMDYATFDVSKKLTAGPGETQTLEFVGRLENLPIPTFDPGAKTYHANTMVIGLWNDYLVKKKGESGPPLLVHSMEIEAPYHPVWPPPSHTNIFFDSPNRNDRETYTREVLTRFIKRAYRRPLRDGEVDRYMRFWNELKSDFDRYEDGVKEVLIAVLCNPNFLYLAEPEKADVDQGVDELAEFAEFALASRLSYFLWNSPPDGQLVALANEGRLREQLSPQVRRMVADDRVWHMVRSFTHEWLRVDRQQFMDTNVKEFPDFTRFVKEDMPEETYHFVHHVLANDLSIINFVRSDFAMLNQNLAEFYGIVGVRGNAFRPVAVEPKLNRGGLLSQGAFLNGHSDGLQPHPIKRAVWLKEKILGDPSPPPPPNVPELDPDTPGFENLTLKEQLELHRNKSSCVSCHQSIDPYGVVFEHLDAVGRYREKAMGKPIDATSVLPDGTKVDGVAGIQDYILNHRSRDVTKAVVEHLFAYALGRDVTFADEEEIQRIVDQAVGDDYRFQSIVESIVLSPSFLKE